MGDSFRLIFSLSKFKTRFQRLSKSKCNKMLLIFSVTRGFNALPKFFNLVNYNA